LQKIGVFTPESSLIILVNILLFLNLLVQAAIIPLRICFYLDTDDYDLALYVPLILFPSIVCILDLILRLNTAYYEEGEIIKDRYSIIKNYFGPRLLIDIFTSFVLFFYKHPFFYSIQILFLLRAYKIS
jgi:hypothetical protein